MITKNGKTSIVSVVLLLLVIIIATAYVSTRQKNPGKGNGSGVLAREKQFVCSMHPEIIQNEPGDCPICGMSLIEEIDPPMVSATKKFVCSMHPEVIKEEAGDCPICGMSLIEKVDTSPLSSKKQFVCSMHPEVIQEEEGDCPICGMSLIVKIEHDLNSADSMLMEVVLPVNESVLGNVAIVNPVEENLPLMIETFGIINYDSRTIQTISARFSGLVERSFVKYQFQPIRKGQKIYEIYCPDIYTEGWKYLRLIQAYPDRDDLTVEAREWLQLLGLTPGQIDSLKRVKKPDYHLTVYSEAEGYAVSADFDPETYFSSSGNGEPANGDIPSGRGGIGFSDGLTIEVGAPLFKIINFHSLRADLKVRTEDVGILKKGQKVVFTDATFPDRKFEALVNQIEPLNGGLFQLVKVYFKDPQGQMKPGRQIQGQILPGDHTCLWVPRSSVFNMGQNQSVFVMQNGRFVPTSIKTGMRSGDQIEVLWGIDQHSVIALNASLLNDSDSFIDSD